MPSKVHSFIATGLEVTNPLYQNNHTMDPLSIILGVLPIVKALKDSLYNLQAAKAYTKEAVSAINNLEGTTRLLENLSRGLTPSEGEMLAGWKVDCEDVLTQLHAQSELSGVGIGKAVAALRRRIWHDSKEADRLGFQLLLIFARLNIIVNSIQLDRR